jgi:hypothetical protein
MDHAVALVQAYLQLNGYFTSAEYPILAGTSRSGFRAMTDIDILVFRFPTGEPMTGRGKKAPKGLDVTMLDERLAVPERRIDMIIGEVKEGRVGINSGICDPAVLKAVVSRFGEVADVRRTSCSRKGRCSFRRRRPFACSPSARFRPARRFLPAASFPSDTCCSICRTTCAGTGISSGTCSSKIRRSGFS